MQLTLACCRMMMSRASSPASLGGLPSVLPGTAALQEVVQVLGLRRAKRSGRVRPAVLCVRCQTAGLRLIPVSDPALLGCLQSTSP